ncbi:MAG TPA: polysaccharide biosynthesis tyrosine autokinase [Blastocatellia bacterium]|nr:polysaccharide biosynthesis tyrosine autokinase [Blastocatellia bacterium]
MSEEKFELEKIPAVEEGQITKPGYPRLNAYPDGSPYGYGYGYNDDERVYLRQMWRAIKKRKLVIIVMAIIVTSVVTVEVFRNKSVYQASTSIDIGKENRTLVRTGDVVVQTDESDDMFYVAVAMKTKIRLLQSRPLLEDVVVNLKLDQNSQFLDVTTRKSFWEAFRSIASKFRKQEQTQEPQVVSETPVAQSNGEGTRSREESARLSPYVDVLASNLSAEPLTDTRMILISFSHTDPVLAADVVDNIAQVFIQRSFENRTERFTSTSDWLDKSTRELQAKVQQAEQALADYSNRHNIYSLEGKDNLAIEKLTRLHSEATRAETERMLKQSLYEQVKAGNADKIPDTFTDTKIGDLQRKLGDLKISLAQLLSTYGPKNPNVITVKDQITAIEEQINDSRKSLDGRLKADYERALRDESSFKAALEQAKAEAAQQNQAAIQYSILKQDVETNKQMYQDFLNKSNQAKIQKAEQQNPMKMIDPPQVPVAPVGPNRLRTITIGFLLSLVAGIGLVFVLEYLDNTVKTVEDIARYTQLPALSIIPAMSGRKARVLSSSNGRKRDAEGLQITSSNGLQTERLMALDGRSSIAEAYRVLRTSVLLSSVDKPPKTILVTSGQPGEGKTTTAVNTAISLAQLGSSVLIIDCDLRRPSAHKLFGVEQPQGLSTYLSRNVKLVDVMQKLPIPNLWILPCGPIPPNPAEMISSARMKEMIRVLGESFDHIIIDSPPLLKVTDPVILSTLVDGVILVVHGGKSTRDIVRRTRQELSQAGAKIFGVVLNNVDVGQAGDDEYYSSYSDYREHGAEASGH